MSKNNPKMKVISVKEASKMNKENIAYFTLTDGTVAVVQKDEQNKQEEIKGKKNSIYQKYKKSNQINNNIQPKTNINSNYEVFKVKNSYQNNNNNYQNINRQNNNGYQIIEAIPVKFCQNPQVRNFSQPEPLYVQPYLNPDIMFTNFQSNDNMSNNYYEINQRKKY